MLKINEIRKTKKITQAQLAERAGVDRHHISDIENGKMSPTVKTLEKIARALGVQTIELIGELN